MGYFGMKRNLRLSLIGDHSFRFGPKQFSGWRERICGETDRHDRPVVHVSSRGGFARVTAKSNTTKTAPLSFQFEKIPRFVFSGFLNSQYKDFLRGNGKDSVATKRATLTVLFGTPKAIGYRGGDPEVLKSHLSLIWLFFFFLLCPFLPSSGYHLFHKLGSLESCLYE